MTVRLKPNNFYFVKFSGCESLPVEWTTIRGLVLNEDLNKEDFPRSHRDQVCLSCSVKNMILTGDKCPTCNVLMPGDFNFTSDPSCKGDSTITNYRIIS